MLQQKYNWILNGCRSLQLRRISELCGLCCYVGKPDPWSLYSTTDPDPLACDPRSRRCDPWSHPIFLLLIPDPIYLVRTLSIYKMRLTEEKRHNNFHLRLFLAEMRLSVLVMCTEFVQICFQWSADFIQPSFLLFCDVLTSWSVSINRALLFLFFDLHCGFTCLYDLRSRAED